MKYDEDDISGALYSECYEASQKATREALRDYDLSSIDRNNLILDTKRNKKSLVFKLFSTAGVTKTLIATTRVNTSTISASVKITNLDEKI